MARKKVLHYCNDPKCSRYKLPSEDFSCGGYNIDTIKLQTKICILVKSLSIELNDELELLRDIERVILSSGRNL